MPEKVFLNDKLIDADKSCISVRDSGFLYGAGLFETMRSHNGTVFALADHLDRLFFSARNLSINNPYDKDYFTEAVYEVLRANKLSDARLRLTFTNGPMVENDKDRKPTLLITATEFRSYPPEYYKSGVLVVLCPYRQNPDDPTCGHKTTSYYSRMIALNMAHNKRAAEALWFTTDNRLAEGCVSNVFLVKDSMLFTPPIETPVLAGVARKTVCQLALGNSVELIEKDLNVDDLLRADEVFLTNVIMQVMPITKVEKHTVGDGKVGPMVKKLHRSFAEYVENECQTVGNCD
ncbi:MAG: aminotransferase class IV family protein [Phycisphaerales bacterium]|nr:MAG: aminotransferase class IV family protein [Phycisphaerales bacterium]